MLNCDPAVSRPRKIVADAEIFFGVMERAAGGGSPLPRDEIMMQMQTGLHCTGRFLKPALGTVYVFVHQRWTKYPSLGVCTADFWPNNQLNKNPNMAKLVDFVQLWLSLKVVVRKYTTHSSSSPLFTYVSPSHSFILPCKVYIVCLSAAMPALLVFFVVDGYPLYTRNRL